MELLEPKEELIDFFDEEYLPLDQAISLSHDVHSYPNVECDGNLLQVNDPEIKTEIELDSAEINPELQEHEHILTKGNPNVQDPLGFCSSLIFNKDGQSSIQRGEISIKRRSRERKVFNCNNCKFQTTFKYKLAIHEKRSSERKSRKCSLCKYETLCLSDLRSHTLKHFKKFIHNCNITSSNFKTNKKVCLNYHLTKHTDVKFKCSKCNFWSTSKSIFRDHFLGHSKRNLNKTFKRHLPNNKIENHKSSSEINQTLKLPYVQIYKCPSCSYKSKEKSLLESHIKIHSLDKSEFLTNCENRIKNHHLVIRSEITDRNLIITNSATKCKKRQNNKNPAKPSREKCNVFKCSICDYKTKTQIWLSRHMLVHTSEKHLNCSQCKFATKYKTSLEKHLLKHTDYLPVNYPKGKHNCSKENHSTHLSEEISKEVLSPKKRIGIEIKYSKDKFGMFKCPICDYKTNAQSMLARHMLVHTSEKHLKCSQCEFATKYKTSLEKHLSKHTNYLPVSSPKSKQNCSKENYSTHLSEEISKKLTPEKRIGVKLKYSKKQKCVFKCSICSYKTKRRYSLNKHMLVHTSEKHLKCSQCEFTTKYKTSLENHLLKHANYMRVSYPNKKLNWSKGNHSTHSSEEISKDTYVMIKCSICDYKTKERSMLARHMLVHTSKKHLKCSQCEFATKYKTSLEIHSLKHANYTHVNYPNKKLDWSKENHSTHSSEETSTDTYVMIKCSICDYKTKERSMLTRHMLVHTSEKHLKCSQCEFATKYKTSLEKHLSLKHSGPEAPEYLHLPMNSLSITHSKENLSIFKCSKCKFTTQNMTIFEKHLCSISETQTHVCSNNELDFTYSGNKSPEKSHEILTKKYEDFKCSICDYKTKEQCLLDQHMYIHCSEKNLKCSKCDFSTECSTSFEKHACTLPEIDTPVCSDIQLDITYSGIQSHESSKNSKLKCDFECSTCDYKTTEQCLLDQHMLVHSSVKSFKCSKCKLITPNISKFEEHLCTLTEVEKLVSSDSELHITNVNNSPQKPFENSKKKYGDFKCSICEYKTKQQCWLNRHMLLHSSIKPFKCPLCVFATKHKSSLKKHLSLKHSVQEAPEYLPMNKLSFTNSKENLSIFKCTKCKFTTQNMTIFEKHLCSLSETQILLSSDNELDFTYSGNKSPEKSHEISTKKYEDFKCSICDYKTKEQCLLDQHMFIHCSEKNLKCPKCDFSTECSTSFEKHACTLPEIDTPVCSDIQLDITYSGIQSHESSKNSKLKCDFECSTCDYKTTEQCLLDQHMLVHSSVKSFKCSKCKLITPNISKFEEHLCTLTEVEKLDHSNSELHITNGNNSPEESFENSKNKYGDFKCSICDYKTRIKYKIDKHMVVHSSEKNFKCSKCEFATKYERSLENHLLTHFKGKPSKDRFKGFGCLICDYKATSKGNIKRHMMIHNSEKLLKCSQCNFATKYNSSLKLHVLRKHTRRNTSVSSNKDMFKCQKSNFSTKRKIILKNPILAHTKTETLKNKYKVFECPNCDYKTSTQCWLNRHMLVHNLVKPFKCSKCEFATINQSYFESHIIKHINENSFPTTTKSPRYTLSEFKCSFCDYTAHLKCILKQHMVVHNTEMPLLKCSKCMFTTKYQETLNKHLVNRHKQTEKKSKLQIHDLKSLKLKNYNFKTFSTRQESKHHENYKSEKTLQKCSICNYKTKCLNNLRVHTLKHFKRLKYKCSITSCNFKTNHKQSLNYHLVKHKDLKFMCSKCNYRSTTKIGLKKHSLMHSTGHKLKSCSKCNFKTYKNIKFEKHLMNHNSRWFKCSKCNFETLEITEFETHLVNHFTSFACHKCIFKTNKKLPLVVHYLFEHNLHQCLLCDYKAQFKSKLKYHMEIHRFENPYKCYKCEFISKSKKNLQNHLLSHYNKKSEMILKPSKTLSENKFAFQSNCAKENVNNPVQISGKSTPVTCPFCPFECDKEENLNEHFQIHTLLCCGYTFKFNDKYNLKMHIESSHVIYEGSCKLFVCKKCTFKAEFKNVLVDHLSIHFPRKPLKCTICPYFASKKSVLKEHIRRYHTPGKKSITYSFRELFLFKCSRCKFKTFSKLEFDIHNKKSNEMKVLKCFSCQYETLCLGNLHSHIFKHFRKLKKCQFCNFKTNHQHLIKIHLRRHRDLKFKCAKCNFRVSCIHYLKKHRLKHNKEINNRKCNFKTNNLSRMKKHISNYHNSKMKFKKFWSIKLKTLICNHPSLQNLSISCRKCISETKNLFRLYPTIFQNKKVNDCDCQHCDNVPTLAKFGSEKNFNQLESVLKCRFCKFENECKRKFFLHLKLFHLKLFKNKCKKKGISKSPIDKIQKIGIPKILSKNTNKIVKSHILPFTLIDKKKIYECFKCNFETDDKRNMRFHLINHLEKRKYKCKSCEYSSNNKRFMSGHEKRHTGDLYSCSACSHKTSHKYSLKIHYLAKHSGFKKYKCLKCDYRSNSNSAFKYHELNHNKTKLFKCSECTYESNSKYRLKVHLKAHNSLKLFNCTDCSFQTNYKGSMERHERIHNENLRLRCTECDYKCAGIQSLQVHMRKHTGENFQCSECSYTTPSKAKLTSHSLRHNKTKLYKCPSCSYESNYKHNFNVHLLTHSGVRLYNCDYCEFSTNYKNMMGQHVLKYH